MQFSDRPTLIPIPFAESGGKATIPDTTVDPGRASWTAGFPPETRQPISAGGIPPNGEDMNGVLFDVADWSRWAGAGGPVGYDATFSTAVGGYPRGAVLASATGQGFWYSFLNNNTNDPDAGGAGWINTLSTFTAVTSSATLNIRQQGIVLIDATAGNITVTLPSAGTPGLIPIKYSFIRTDSTTSTVTISRAGSDTIEGVTSLTIYVANRITLVSDGASAWRMIGSVAYGASVGLNGWQRLGNGMIRQWGQATTDGTGGLAVVFPVAFVSAAYNVTLGSNIAASAIHGYQALTASGFYLQSWNPATGVAEPFLTATWQALGR